MDKILLSFDLEEFDIPEEYGHPLSAHEKLERSREGLVLIMALLQKLNISATFYTTAFFAQAYPDLIRQLSEHHEIASHGFYHSSFQNEDLLSSKTVLEQITGKPVSGFRMARLQPVDESLLVDAGYSYNASLNPTWIPGRYNHLDKPRNPFLSNGLTVLPASVASWFRIPLFWISFKVLPELFYRRLALSTLRKTHYLNIYFHPWEFSDISSYRIPAYTKRICGQNLLLRLERLLIALKKHGDFIQSAEFNKAFLKTQTTEHGS
jgi:peptidoglycan/xylan/chitin deacetylase (PgdA/CDA1 family)